MAAGHERTLINVSNRLPITVSDDKITKSSGGLVAALEGLSEKDLALKWIGWPGGDIPTERQDEIARTLQDEHGCSPVFLSSGQVEAFYEGFSNSSLWPLLHYMPSRFRYLPAWAESYREVNRRFCEAVLSVATDGDLVWVHDYQLMLLPAMLRERMPSLKIGFFLHTPFPSFEVFRCHPCRRELVTGLLGADLLGFHTFGYLRHFRSSVLRLLGLEAEMMRIRHDGRETRLGVYPIGINASKFQEELESQPFKEQLAKTLETHEGMEVVMSVERLDYTKGLLHRLDAIDLFLSRAADKERVKFIMISVPSRENVDEYRELREEVEWKVGRINGKYATLNDSPIRFIHGSVNFTELCALYAVADVGLVTPLIDGMNLVAKEYIACQRPEDAGVLVLSEFAGAAEELFNALIVNPYDTQALANAIEQGLAMSPAERRGRMALMRERVLQFDATAWARAFLDDLRRRCREEKPGEADARDDLSTAQKRIARAIRSGRKVAFFLDYDGTLREIVRDPSEAAPTPEVRRTLDALRRVKHADVTIISGRTAEDLERFVGDYPFGLIAEHGAALRRPHERHWEQLDRNTDYSWKDELLRVLRLYERSTPGSFVEIKRTSLVWHYRRSDPEFGEWKAKHLTEELALLTANEPLHIRHGKKIVEISPTQINKGAAVTRILESEGDHDLVIVAGDDQTDLSMYRLSLEKMISINVGDEAVDAQYRVPNPAALRRFLQEAVGN
jgi:trehalose 6-phosphate synthase/phosphatase